MPSSAAFSCGASIISLRGGRSGQPPLRARIHGQTRLHRISWTKLIRLPFREPDKPSASAARAVNPLGADEQRHAGADAIARALDQRETAAVPRMRAWTAQARAKSRDTHRRRGCAGENPSPARRSSARGPRPEDVLRAACESVSERGHRARELAGIEQRHRAPNRRRDRAPPRLATRLANGIGGAYC
jgi:hypothetical protein